MRHATLTGHPPPANRSWTLPHHRQTVHGEYVTLEADAAVAPIGNDEDAAEMDLQQMLAWQ